MKKNWFFAILMIGSWSVAAQQQVDTFDLVTAEVVGSRLENFGLGQGVGTFSAEDLDTQSGGGLDDLLNTRSSIFIKSYGAGSLASPSSRGTGFGHTAVLWNGFNLQSPLNGGIDFSLLPLYLTDEVKLQQGGSGALFGSGAIGGVVHLNQKASLQSGLHGSVGINGGSFGRLGQQVKISHGTKKWTGDFRVLHDQAKNDFFFGNETNRRQQTNAQLQQWAFTQHNQFHFGKNQVLKTWSWVQTTHREIPPNRIENNVNAQQQDTSLRFAAEWQRFGKQQIQKVRTAWLDERFAYTSNLQTPGITRSKSLITEMENEWVINARQRLLTGINYTHEVGIAPAIFDNSVSRNRIAAFLSYKQSVAQWEYVLNLRKEWVLDATAPFTGSLGIKSPTRFGFFAEAQVSKNYKLPTFNDLYWTGAQARGNGNLLPEESWSTEASLVYQQPTKAYDWINRITAFNILVNDWILWTPQGDGVWQPDNLRKVWSRGIEASTSFDKKINHWHFTSELLYQWNRATNQKVYSGATDAFEKQLIHVPLHSARGQVGLTYRTSQLTYRHQFTGIRFTSSDNENLLPSYQLGDVILKHDFLWANKKLQLQFQVENIWNVNYEVLRYRPMPGRGFWLAVTFDF